MPDDRGGMTAEPQLPPITCPTSLIASCGPLLGFEPRHCVVALVGGVPGRPGPVLVRIDLGDRRSAQRRAREMATGIAGTGGTHADIVAFVDAADDTPRAGLPTGPFLHAVGADVMSAGLQVTTSITTNGSTWWSHGCPDETCCGGSAPLDATVLTRVRAEYAYAGFAPLASREEVVARVAPDPVAAVRVAEGMLRIRPLQSREAWRDSEVSQLDGWLVPPAGDSCPAASRTASRPGPDRVARTLRALHDIPVRDTLLLRLIGALDAPAQRWRESMELLCLLVRQAPSGSVAPAATLLALVSWLRGDGALANAALDLSDLDDPHYRLAGLARRVMASGLDPLTWRDAMSGLTEEECRHPGSRRS
jgi:hypothetical protein